MGTMGGVSGWMCVFKRGADWARRIGVACRLLGAPPTWAALGCFERLYRRVWMLPGRRAAGVRARACSSSSSSCILVVQLRAWLIGGGSGGSFEFHPRLLSPTLRNLPPEYGIDHPDGLSGSSSLMLERSER